MRDAMRLVLGGAGWEIEDVADGRAALEAIRQRPPDLVVMDLNMPEVHGSDVLAAIRADPATAGVSVIVVTASGEEDRAATLRAGADAFFTKPFEPAGLVETVRALLEGPSD